MHKQELIKPYKGNSCKREQVELMFNRIARTYDTLNHTLAWGIDKRWRKQAIDSLKPYAPKHILDIATGTGDFAILAAKRLKSESIVGADISEGMMNVGREKVHREGLDDVIRFVNEDCTQMSFTNDSFDAITSAYGVRNFEHLEDALREMHRVLKPNGRLVIVELCTPNHFPLKQLFALYARVVMPLIGRIISKDNSAYTYLPMSMEAFPQGEVMKGILENSGFKDVNFRRFTFGISTLYQATK